MQMDFEDEYEGPDEDEVAAMEELEGTSSPVSGHKRSREQQQQQQPPPALRTQSTQQRAHVDREMNSVTDAIEIRLAHLDPKLQKQMSRFAGFCRAAVDLSMPNANCIEGVKTVPVCEGDPAGGGKIKVFAQDRFEDGCLPFVQAIVAMQQLAFSHTAVMAADAAVAQQVLPVCNSAYAHFQRHTAINSAELHDYQREHNSEKWQRICSVYAAAPTAIVPREADLGDFAQGCIAQHVLCGIHAVDRHRLQSALEEMRKDLT